MTIGRSSLKTETSNKIRVEKIVANAYIKFVLYILSVRIKTNQQLDITLVILSSKKLSSAKRMMRSREERIRTSSW